MNKLLDAMLILGVLPELRTYAPPLLPIATEDEKYKPTFDIVREADDHLPIDDHLPSEEVVWKTQRKRKKTLYEKKQKKCRAVKKKSRKSNRKKR